MGECELYGGWLVQINDLKEYNCLLRYGSKEFEHEWFWTDAKNVDEVYGLMPLMEAMYLSLPPE